jgi:hypothetical protein
MCIELESSIDTKRNDAWLWESQEISSLCCIGERKGADLWIKSLVFGPGEKILSLQE